MKETYETKRRFKYTKLLEIFGGNLQSLDNIEEWIDQRILALNRLKRANTNFKNRLLNQMTKELNKWTSDKKQ